MKRFIATLMLVGATSAGLSVVPAEATVSTPAVSQSANISQSAQYEDWKMGARPASSTICLANGVAGYSMAYVMGFLTDQNSGLKLYVGNRCDGYSITNRMTITTYSDSTTTCSKYTNTGRVWDGVQGKYIWNQNPVIWANTNDFCMPNDTAKAHRFALFVEYILGATPETDACRGTIGSTLACINQVKYAQLYDRQLMNHIYGLAA